MFPKVSFLSHYKLKKIYNQTDKLLHSNGKHQQNEKTTSEQEKIFTTHETVKGLISKIYKQVIGLNNPKQTTQSKNQQKT